MVESAFTIASDTKPEEAEMREAIARAAEVQEKYVTNVTITEAGAGRRLGTTYDVSAKIDVGKGKGVTDAEEAKTEVRDAIGTGLKAALQHVSGIELEADPASVTATPKTAAPTSSAPTPSPTKLPTASPSARPTTSNPTGYPSTAFPTPYPTAFPTAFPLPGGTLYPTAVPSTGTPTGDPTQYPTGATAGPTASPSLSPSASCKEDVDWDEANEFCGGHLCTEEFLKKPGRDIRGCKPGRWIWSSTQALGRGLCGMLDKVVVRPADENAMIVEETCTNAQDFMQDGDGKADALCCWDDTEGVRRRQRRRRLADLEVTAEVDMAQRTTGAPASISKAVSDARAALRDADKVTDALASSGLNTLGSFSVGSVTTKEVLNATAAAAATAAAQALAAGSGPVHIRVDKTSDDGERDVNYWLAVGFGVAFGVISVGFCGYVSLGGAFGYKRGVGVPMSPKAIVPRGVVPSPTPAEDSLRDPDWDDGGDGGGGGGGGGVGGDPALAMGGTVGLAIEAERSTCEGWLEQLTKLKDGVTHRKFYYVLYPKQMQLRYYKDVVKTSEAESANLHIGEEGTLFLGAMVDAGKGKSREGSSRAEDGDDTKGRRISLKFHYIPRSVTRGGKGRGSVHRRRTRRVEFVAPTKDDAKRWIRALRKFQAKFGHISAQPFDSENYRPHSTGRGVRGRPRTMGDTMRSPGLSRTTGSMFGGSDDTSASDSGDQLQLPGGALSSKKNKKKKKKRSQSVSRRSSRKGRTLPPLRIGGRSTGFTLKAPPAEGSEWTALAGTIGSPRYR